MDLWVILECPSFNTHFPSVCPPPITFCLRLFSRIGGEQALICNGCSQPVLSSDESISTTFCMRMAWKRHPRGDGWRGPRVPALEAARGAGHILCLALRPLVQTITLPAALGVG